MHPPRNDGGSADAPAALPALAEGVDLAADEFRVAVFAPVGRTAELASAELGRAGLACTVCAAMDELCEAVRRGAGAVLLVEESLSSLAAVRLLAAALAEQPAWSDVHVQVFVADAETASPPLAALLDATAGRSVVLLHRPVPRASLVSVMRAALHSRARQYALRDLLGRYEEARAAADAANRAKGDFLSVMSHELRTPLNAIGGYAELIEMGIRGPVTPAMRTDLERIRFSQKHLLGLVNEVLSYTKLETGTVEFDLADVPVGDAFAAAEALVLPQAGARGLALEIGRPERALSVRADPDRLRQVLVNLLSNAVKFTEPGGRVSLHGARDGESVRLAVRDSGIGIPADRLAAVFEPFVQVRTDLTRTQEGTGLGLAISRQLARGMGGDLVVESTPGAGSMFTLTLPAGGTSGTASTAEETT